MGKSPISSSHCSPSPAVETGSTRTGFKGPEEVLDRSTCEGRRSDPVLEAPIGSTEDGVMDYVLGRHQDVERNRDENEYVSESAHYPLPENQGMNSIN